MANFVFTIAKGRGVYYATLPAANDALIAVVLESSGLEADSTLQDYDDLSTLLAGTSNEQTTMGRKTLTNVSVTLNDTTQVATVDCDDIVWTSATGNATGKLLICYDGDTTAGTDSNIVPVAGYDFTATPDGSNITAQINASGLFTAS